MAIVAHAIEADHPVHPYALDSNPALALQAEVGGKSSATLMVSTTIPMWSSRSTHDSGALIEARANRSLPSRL